MNELREKLAARVAEIKADEAKKDARIAEFVEKRKQARELLEGLGASPKLSVVLSHIKQVIELLTDDAEVSE